MWQKRSQRLVRRFLDSELIVPLDGHIRHMKDFQLKSFRTMTVTASIIFYWLH
jgi:hypothetical protein